MTSNYFTEDLHAMADVAFLEGTYSDLGFDLDGVVGNSMRWGGDLGYFVASQLVSLMDARPTRNFPPVMVVEPTSGLSVPLRLNPTKYRGVARENLRNPTRTEKPSEGREGVFELRSVVPFQRGIRNRKLGSFTIESSDMLRPGVTEVELWRKEEEDREVFWGIGPTDPEAVAFISLAKAFLEEL